MNKLFNKLLNNISTLVDFDLTCFIKFDQYSFKLIDYYFMNGRDFDFQSILNNIETSKFLDIQKLILDKYNFSSSILSEFTLDNNQYYILSASNKVDQYTDNKKILHLKITESINELTILLEE